MFTLFFHQSNGTFNFVDNVEVKSGRFQGTQSWESMEIDTDLKIKNFYSRLHKLLNSLHLTYYALYLMCDIKMKKLSKIETNLFQQNFKLTCKS